MKRLSALLVIMAIMLIPALGFAATIPTTIIYPDEMCFKHPTVADTAVCCQPMMVVTAAGAAQGCKVDAGTTPVQVDRVIYLEQANLGLLNAHKTNVQNVLAQ